MAVLEIQTVLAGLCLATHKNQGGAPTLVIVGTDSWRAWVREMSISDRNRSLRGIPVRLSNHVESYQIIW